MLIVMIVAIAVVWYDQYNNTCKLDPTREQK